MGHWLNGVSKEVESITVEVGKTTNPTLQPTIRLKVNVEVRIYSRLGQPK